MLAGCTCDTGFSGSISATATAPNFYTGNCVSVLCKALSFADLMSFCVCQADPSIAAGEPLLLYRQVRTPPSGRGASQLVSL